jgi:hypothetical protein
VGDVDGDGEEDVLVHYNQPALSTRATFLPSNLRTYI